MKRTPLLAAVTFTLLMTSAPVASQSAPQEEILLPEVPVTGDAAARQHPQDSTWSEDRILGCVEVVTPHTGGELGGSFQARNAKHGIPVIPSLNNPSSASDNYQRGVAIYHQTTPVGQKGKPGCQN
jgi:hypothetical protein